MMLFWLGQLLIWDFIDEADSNNGLPCAVQIVAPNMRDELLVEAGEIISDCLAAAE
jgi:Asp-tRNA(Asn)/Glu-tRNA(Gln) amidotransferase A subunit family amidase